MATAQAKTESCEPSVAALVTAIVGDIQTLVWQESELATQELRESVGSAAVSVFRITAAGVISALGLALLAVGAALAIPAALAWPAWSGFAAVGAALLIAGSTGVWLGAPRTGQKEERPWQSRPN